MTQPNYYREEEKKETSLLTEWFSLVCSILFQKCWLGLIYILLVLVIWLVSRLVIAHIKAFVDLTFYIYVFDS